MDNIKHLIKLQYKLRNISDLVSTAVKMIQLFPENIYPLEWVCKVVLQKVPSEANPKVRNHGEGPY